jgi:two-component system NtrC family sensor kinase
MKPKIVYVDDEPANCVVFESTFEDDFEVFCASSGQEALEVLDQTGAPIIIADQRMPGMSGVELCEVVHRKYPCTKRIILTGYSDSNAMLDAINKGRVFHFLTKPWDRHVLFQVIHQALESHELAIANMALTERLLSFQRLATLGRATAEIAHELGNRVAMLPLIEMIEERYAGDAELLEMAKFARETSDRLTALIEEIKSFVRCDGTHLDVKPFCLADAIYELTSFLRFDQSIPSDRLITRIWAEPTVSASKAKLQQVLVNLLKNAADAIRDRHDGRIELAVGIQGEQAVLTVTDNGCGMTPEIMARIWEPFFTTKADKGTGLGLDISRRIVESHGGTIHCDSEAGLGTTFTVHLPMLCAKSVDSQPTAEIAPRVSCAVGSLRS